MDKINLGRLYAKHFVSFNLSSKERKIIFNGTEKHKLGEGVFAFVNISDEELAFYDDSRADLISFSSRAIKDEMLEETQKFIWRYSPLHPYFKYCNPTSESITLMEAKSKVLDILKFCLDKDYNSRLNALTAIERYYIYFYSNRGEIPFLITPKVALTPTSIGVDKYSLFLKPLKNFKASSLWDFEDNREPQELSDELIAFVKEQKPILHEAYEFDDIVSLLYLEIFKMIESNNYIRVCKRCGIYFTLKGNYPAEYCDRKRPGHKRNCQDEAAKEKEKRKYKEESAEKLYNRLRTRIAKRTKEGCFGEDYLKKWESSAKPLYQEFIADKEADYNEFKAKLEALSK